MLKVLLNPIIL